MGKGPKPWHDTVMHVGDAKDGPCGTVLLLACDVEEARDLLRRAAALLAREAPWREMADRWECEDAARECDEHAAVLDECMEDHP